MFKFDDLKTTNLPISDETAKLIIKECISYTLQRYLGVEGDHFNVDLIMRLIYLSQRLDLVNQAGVSWNHRTLADFIVDKGFNDLFPSGK